MRSTRGYTVIDDAYNANPASMEWAVKTLAALPCRGKRIAILGDMRELGDDGSVSRESSAVSSKTSNLSLILLVGEAMKAAAAEAGTAR